LPNIFKRFSSANLNVEPYQFPDESEIVFEDETLMEEEEPEPENFGEEVETPPAAEKPPEEPNPIDFAMLQAEAILVDAHRQAQDIIDKAKAQAEEEAKDIKAAAQEKGRLEGYAQGMEQAQQESKAAREKQAQELENDVVRYLGQVSQTVDRYLDEHVNELSEIAMAVAEKVVCVSLKSSSQVISRMIQKAVDKRKRREWARIYIAQCDVSKLAQVPTELAQALAELSDRVRIVPVAGDESGTCIIEMPDEIVDASASTQLSNLRGIVTGGASTGMTIHQ
jgi:flagellar assembly protein FliH